MLWLGWNGFNGADPYFPGADASAAILNTNLAAATAMIPWMFLDVFIGGRVTVGGLANGMIAALVGITPAAGYGQGHVALAIGTAAAQRQAVGAWGRGGSRSRGPRASSGAPPGGLLARSRQPRAAGRDANANARLTQTQLMGRDRCGPGLFYLERDLEALETHHLLDRHHVPNDQRRRSLDRRLTRKEGDAIESPADAALVRQRGAADHSGRTRTAHSPSNCRRALRQLPERHP